MVSPKICRGITLIELLVVIAIISLLVQLTVPAIQSAREAARRTTCRNNLRQIGVAVMSNEASQQQLPTGGWGWAWMGDPDSGTGKNQPGSWAYQLLPYLEQDAIHDVGRGTIGDAKLDGLSRLAEIPVPLFYCPSRRANQATPNTGPQAVTTDGMFWYNARRSSFLARTDYAANIGDRWVYWNEGPPPGKAEAGEGFFRFRDIDLNEGLTIQDVTGVVVQRHPFRFQQILDGASKTYFAGEKRMAVEAYDSGSGLNDDQSCWNGDDLDLMASTQFVPGEDLVSATFPIGQVGATFGSAHVSQMHMLFCDGSVQSVAYEIDPRVHLQLGNRRDR